MINNSKNGFLYKSILILTIIIILIQSKTIDINTMINKPILIILLLINIYVIYHTQYIGYILLFLWVYYIYILQHKQSFTGGGIIKTLSKTVLNITFPLGGSALELYTDYDDDDEQKNIKQETDDEKDQETTTDEDDISLLSYLLGGGDTSSTDYDSES